MSSANTVHLDTELAMSQIGDAEAMHGMLGMLEDTLANDIVSISTLLAQGDVAGANRLLHPLKGFIPIFCSPALCEQVSAVEGLSKHGGCAEVSAAYDKLKPELELLLAEVAAFLRVG